MKKIVTIALLLLLLLGSGGAAAWWYFYQDGQEIMAEAVRFESDPGYYSFEPFVVPVVQRNKVTHHVTVQLTVLLGSDDFESEAEGLAPRLKDGVLRELYSLYNMRLVRDEGFNSPLIQDHIMKIAQSILGEDKVTGIRLNIVEKQKPTGA